MDSGKGTKRKRDDNQDDQDQSGLDTDRAPSHIGAEGGASGAEGDASVNSPPPPVRGTGRNNEKIESLNRKLREKLGEEFRSKGKGVWKKIRKELMGEKGFSKSRVQNVNCLEDIFDLLMDKGKIKPGSYGFLRNIIVRHQNRDTGGEKIIDEISSEIRCEREGQPTAPPPKRRRKSKK